MILKTIIYCICFTLYSFITLANNIEGKGLLCSKYKSYLEYDESEYDGYWFSKHYITKYSIEGYKVKKFYKVKYRILTRYIEWEHESCPKGICILNRETLKVTDYQCNIVNEKLNIINKLENYIEDQKSKNKI